MPKMMFEMVPGHLDRWTQSEQVQQQWQRQLPPLFRTLISDVDDVEDEDEWMDGEAETSPHTNEIDCNEIN